MVGEVYFFRCVLYIYTQTDDVISPDKLCMYVGTCIFVHVYMYLYICLCYQIYGDQVYVCIVL